MKKKKNKKHRPPKWFLKGKPQTMQNMGFRMTSKGWR